MNDLTDEQVDRALARLGNYRVRRVQAVANAGLPDGISGALLLALGLRETGLQNVEGGAKWDVIREKWIPQDDPNLMDVGVFQISRKYHMQDLQKMIGVKSGTWTPVVITATAATPGFVPRFEESLQYVLMEMHENMALLENSVLDPDRDLVQAAVAAHNAGVGGSAKGYREGDVDKYTAGGDYSEWVFRHRTKVNRWLKDHPKWLVQA